MDDDNTMNLDSILDTLKSTVDVMKNTVSGLTQRGSTIYNLLQMSDIMKNKGDYQDSLPANIILNKNIIVKCILAIFSIYIIFTVFSYLFVNYILFYGIIIVGLIFAIKYFGEQYNLSNDGEPLLQDSYHNFEAHSI
ncbi:conserved Plasmodium protein, unknown function [Plasmodium chabaudi chabaudi]|uniref:Uncharacterized protein n=2 Tax=Plasmodium chabaudi TaxID=5825 RepID=A0A077TL89_PLACU|nr:conserved Plasmodium protein, unknown function [Plasmodium chabaudi chabaudi]SCM22772.1 conserved Plasmodium protein, unknown function [Plasmodium chabaudi adami]SCM23959.1 conserved Plasmodium protein, unknown function [Plasmodium chabaudi chabaudi]SCN61435.1 conserved Plasmodium protein, unknown function [Plasmodium chabaudi chabaudi]SCN61436.1 conserved Plasmodium protein, unknown function [Plasmodium chabaudi adami]VTZ69337.1 conserved Plasmodium protein, unknown function [Plasmodium ch|eukprot:XP_016654050.1 conserved Plasmodium protein, unknown function [Plasmodium chabaudi chabaudi]